VTPQPAKTTVEDLLREFAPRVLAALVGRYGPGQFHLCEDATQEALLAAAVQWPAEGVPDNPRGWLVTVASRKLLDQVRSEQARREREDRIALAAPQSELLAGPADASATGATSPAGADDSLALLFGCCHPAISVPSQIALTLRAIGGLTTAQIAAAFGVPEATMAQRISRAKQALRDARVDFGLHGPVAERLPAVLHVLYLVFNEGYTASEGDAVTVPALSGEAIRLTRWLYRLLPEEAEVAGLLALMLLTDARRPARTRPDGSLVPLAEQDRARWDRAMIDEGTALISTALASGQVGPYQLQAAIAAVHDEAATMDDTDWEQILGLYDLLELAAPNPFTTLNRAVAEGMVNGPEKGLELLETLAEDKRMGRHHRLFAARGHLLELAGEHQRAADAYAQAARLSTSIPERRYLAAQATRLQEALSEEIARYVRHNKILTLSPTEIVPPVRMSARRPPRWMRSLMMPGRVSC
jgi:RNA polymerase sigma factor (sigma-70 family)